MERYMKLCILLIILFTNLSFSVGEKYTSIIVSKQVNEKNGTILLNITVLYFNASRVEIPQELGQPPKIVEQADTISIENATVYTSFYNTSYTDEGKLVQTLAPLPCSPIATNESYEEDGKIVYFGRCIIEGELYSKYFNNTCRGLNFYFPGMSLPRESIPPTETTMDVCTGKPTIFEALRGILASTINPEDPFCISIFIIFGLLLATLFFAGRSPLALLDVVTPFLPKPRRFAYTAGVHAVGHKKMKEAADTVMKETNKRIKEMQKKVTIPEELRDLYRNAESWKKILVLKALEKGDDDLAKRILNSDAPFTIASTRFGEDKDVKLAYLYLYMEKMMEAYDRMLKVSKNKYVGKVLKWMGKLYPLQEIPIALATGFMTTRFVKMAVKAPFIRRGELKRIKAVETAKNKKEEMAARAELEGYRKKHEINPVQRLFDPLVYGEEFHKTVKEQVSKEVIAYLILRVFGEGGVDKKNIEKIFERLKDGIAKNNKADVDHALKQLEELIGKLDKMDPRYSLYTATINRLRAIANGTGDPYAKAYGALYIIEKEKILTDSELADLKNYIRNLSSIDRNQELMDIQKFLRTVVYIKDYRATARGEFIPMLFTFESDRKKISGNIAAMLFANEILSQPDADLSDIATFFFGMRMINTLFPLMPYDRLPADFKNLVKKKGLAEVYNSVSSFSMNMFEKLANKAHVSVKKNYNNFEGLGIGIFNPLKLNTSGDWHVFPSLSKSGKVSWITSSAFGRALELSSIGRVKVNFEDAFKSEAFMHPFSYYSVSTKNLVDDSIYQLGAVGYASVRYYAAKKLGVDVDNLTDAMFKRFISNKKNLDLYLTDFDKGSFILMKGWGAIPFVQDVLNPDQKNPTACFMDKKISEYIKSLGYDTSSYNSIIYSLFAPKGGIGLPDSFINTTIMVKVGDKFRIWKGQGFSEDALDNLDSTLLKKGDITAKGDFIRLYNYAAGGDVNAFEKVKELLIKYNRMDAFMPLADAYQMAAKGVSRAEAFKGITTEHVKYIPLSEARNEAKAFMDRIRLWTETALSGAVKPIVYAGVPYWDAIGTVVASSEVARRIGAEYVRSLAELSKEEADREKKLATAIKDFEHAWEWTITRDALLYGGFERYGRPGYITTGFHVGPAMPVTNWMDKRSFSPLFQSIPILDRIMQNIALATFKLSVGVSRPFVLGARAFGVHRTRYPSPYDLRSDIYETNPSIPTQAYYPVYNTIPRVRIGATLLQGFAFFAAPVLLPFAFFREMQERKELPLGGRVIEGIRNSFTRAHEMLVPRKIMNLGIGNSHIYIGAPRMTDTYWFYSTSMANIGDDDTNPGLSYIQSYTGAYVWQPLVGRVLERHNIPVFPRLREQMFTVHEKRTISALGLAAFYYNEIHWADPFNFKDNPLYTILSPGTALLQRGGLGWKKGAKKIKERFEYMRHHPGGFANWNQIKFGGASAFKAVADFVKGRQERWLTMGSWVTCPFCGTKYNRPGPCPTCRRKR